MDEVGMELFHYFSRRFVSIQSALRLARRKPRNSLHDGDQKATLSKGRISWPLKEEPSGSIVAASVSTSTQCPENPKSPEPIIARVKCPENRGTSVAPETSAFSESPLDPQDHSLLFKLPSELRLMIYEIFFEKSKVLVAEDWACSKSFRKNSHFLPTARIEKQSQASLRFAHIYEDDDEYSAWVKKRSKGSQSRRHKRDEFGDVIIKRFEINLMSTCRKAYQEMAPILYSKKTLVLALSSLLITLKIDYLSPLAFARIRRLHIHLCWCETDNSSVCFPRMRSYDRHIISNNVPSSSGRQSRR